MQTEERRRLIGAVRSAGRTPFRATVHAVPATRTTSSYRSGCPVPLRDLRLLRLTHLDLDGRVQTGELVVHATLAEGVVRVFRRLYEAQFPIARMRLVDEYGGSDDRSMAANNTSAFNCRAVTGGSSWSEHAYGRAIDVNPVQNPYVRGSTVEPHAGRAYLDRSARRPGMAEGLLVQAFAAEGWRWGGTWSSSKDYQHFSTTGR